MSRRRITAQNYNTTNAVLGGSVVFDGSGDYVVVSDASALEIGAGSFTIEMWVKTTSSTQYATLFNRNTDNNGPGAFIVMMNLASATAGEIGVYSSSLGISGTSTSGVNVRDGAWHHIAVVRNGTAFNIYVDGTSRASQTISGTVSDTSGNWYIGADQYFLGSRDFGGNISNLRVVRSAVYTGNFTAPSSQLTAIANTGLLTCQSSTSILDNSGNSLTLTTSGNAAATTDNPFT
jgi:hypothetical protein